MVSERVPYLLDGEEVPSVTEILNIYGAGHEHLMGWANSLGKKGTDYREELDRLATIGTCVHGMIEEELTGEWLHPDYGLSVMQAAARCMGLFRRWCEGKEIEVIWHERRMVSRDFRCGGTADLLCTLDDGAPVLVDFKTSSAIRAKNIAQVAAYVDMVNEIEDRRIDRACILRFGRDGTSEELWVEGEMLERGRGMFLLARQMYEASKQLTLDAKMGTKLVQREVKRVPIRVMGVQLYG